MKKVAFCLVLLLSIPTIASVAQPPSPPPARRLTIANAAEGSGVANFLVDDKPYSLNEGNEADFYSSQDVFHVSYNCGGTNEDYSVPAGAHATFVYAENGIMILTW